MKKQTHITVIVIALMIQAMLPLTAGAENYNNVGPQTFIAIGAYLLLIFGGAIVCCVIVYKKTGKALTWLMFPIWAYAIYMAICVAGYLATTLYESVKR